MRSTPSLSWTIPELEQFEVLEGLVAEYALVNGPQPFNVSHWDPCPAATRVLLEHMVVPPVELVVPYIYSYDLDLDVLEQIVEKLGFSRNANSCLITPSGTSAITMGLWWLKCSGVKELVILAPTYFPVISACELIGLKSSIVYLTRQNGKWSIPQRDLEDVLMRRSTDIALWVTNPIFSTGVYLDAKDASFLSSLLHRGAHILADECLAMNGKELGRTIGQDRRFLGIYSPHKSISINAIKFASIVFSKAHERFFEQWSDVIVGGLGSSSVSAIRHFLGPNFSICHNAVDRYISGVSRAVAELARNIGPGVELDPTAIGHFRSCYIPGIKATNADSPVFLRRLIFETGSLALFGTRSHFDPRIGFSFRLNLARGGPEFMGAVARLLRQVCH